MSTAEDARRLEDEEINSILDGIYEKDYDIGDIIYSLAEANDIDTADSGPGDLMDEVYSHYSDSYSFQEFMDRIDSIASSWSERRSEERKRWKAVGELNGDAREHYFGEDEREENWEEPESAKFYGSEDNGTCILRMNERKFIRFCSI